MTWWHRTLGYEVYIRSFADGDGDGVGDLEGIRGRLDRLAWLGVGAIWISPFMPSPMHDHGYDVSDYTDIHPDFGDLAAFDRLVADAGQRGIRVLVDLVPNHTSDQHPWFQAALADPEGPYRDYYIWRDPRPDGGPPNNWLSHFGGSAWTLDEASGQYWLHLFLPQQPDLNWRNPAVHDEFARILQFWIDRGAAGFRIDVAHSLHKHPELPDLPSTAEVDVQFTGREFGALDHVYDMDQPDNVLAHRSWRQVTAPADALLLGETYVLGTDRLRRYHEPDEGLNASFWFPPLHMDWDHREIRRVVVDAMRMPSRSLAWITGSHDRPRVVSRFGGGEAGRARSLAMAALLWGLDGMPFLYQGEELGLENARLTLEQMQDPLVTRNPELAHLSRDQARTPMPWQPGPGMGFTTAAETWLPFGGWTDADTWAVQEADEGSWLHAWRRLVDAWKALPEGLADPTWMGEGGPVIAYRRDPLVVAVNAGDTAVEVPLPGDGAVAFHRDPDRQGRAVRGTVWLQPDHVAWVRLGGGQG